MSRSTIWAWSTMLVRLWAGPSCICRAISRRRSSWAVRMMRDTPGGTGPPRSRSMKPGVEPASASPSCDGAASPGGIPATTLACSAWAASASWSRIADLRLPSRRSTWASMRAAFRATATSWLASSARSLPAALPPAARRSAVAASFSAAAARRRACRLASVLAWLMSRSISSTSPWTASAAAARRAAMSAAEVISPSAVSSSGGASAGAGATASAGTVTSVLRHLDPALAHRIHDGLGPVVDGQLAQDRAHVVLHGLLADRQRVGDLLVGHALGDVVEDLDLARRQRREDRLGLLAVDRELAELLEDARRDGRLGEHLVVDEELALRDAADDEDEVVGADVLDHERGGAGLDRGEERLLVLV